MVPHELHINLNGIDYHVRLISQDTVEWGTEKGKKVSLGMAMSHIHDMRKSKGILEAHTSLDGNELKDWVRDGTFRETCESYAGHTAYFLRLNLRGMRIEIKECYYDSGKGTSCGAMKTRKHWYNRWKETKLEDPCISKS